MFVDCIKITNAFITVEADKHSIIRISFKKTLVSLPNKIIEQFKTELKDYLTGKLTKFNVPISLSGTAFTKAVLIECLRIPHGTTRSYSEIAHLIGSPKAARAVGSALNKNLLPIIIPCHRVVSKTGNPYLYAGGEELKKFLLNLEQAHI